MISLHDVQRAANGQLFGEPSAQLFTEFCFDPAAAHASALFVAVRTPTNDTHHQIGAAIENGVGGVICVGPPEADTSGVSVLMVADTHAALLAWSRLVIRKYRVRTVAVAGSSGTSVAAAAVAQLLQMRHAVQCGELDGTGTWLLPISVARLKPEHDVLVLKCSPDSPGDMRDMVEAAMPQAAVITHIDCWHPPTFESCDHLRDEYAALLEALPDDGLAVLNYDSEMTADMTRRTSAQVKTVGMDQFGANLLAYNVLMSTTRTAFDLRFESERYVAQWTPLLGRESLYAVLAALLVAEQHDVPVHQGLRLLKEMPYLPGRMAPLRTRHNALLIDDTFRAGVASAQAALEWAAQVREEVERVIFVMGRLDDFGQRDYMAHRAVGYTAAETVDVFIGQGRKPTAALTAAVDEGVSPDRIRATYTVHDTVAALENYGLKAGDLIVIKGAASARMENVVAQLLPHDADRSQLVRQNPYQTMQAQPYLPLRPSWVEVELDQLARNMRSIREMLAGDVAVMVVVKADAYGHGAVMVAQTALLNGATHLAVASLSEALQLRDGGIQAPVLILSYTPAYAVQRAIEQNLTVTLFDLETARQYNSVARRLGRKLTCHVKIDTGMGRLGVMAADAIQFFRHLAVLEHLNIEGIFTHFSTADDDLDYTEQQVATFKNVFRPLRASGFDFKYIHAANSPATLQSDAYHFNMVRPGLLVYGMRPAPHIDLPPEVAPLLTWKTTILQVKTLPPGHPVGYGNTYRTTRDERIAILPVGYADGLRRSPNTWKYVLVHGQRAPLIGRVSMEKCAISVQHIPDVRPGDEVVLLGRQGDEVITADDIAGWLGTINYEVVTSILPRVERIRV